ncbi:MAG: hypothetical protein WCA08_07270 [Desulfoferrobacter sp.]
MSGHHHHHSHDDHTQRTPHEKEKLTKMVEHWIQHNIEHARSYREWAQRADDLGQKEVAEILSGIAAHSTRQNEDMERALALLKNG